jgi:putative transcriptional regulator
MTGARTTKTIAHHLDIATLMSFASGSLPEALSAVAAAHVAQCSVCAAEVRRMERIGAALLATVDSTSLTKPAPTLALRRQQNAEAPKKPITPTAQAVRDIIEGGFDRVQWRRLGVGLWHARLPTSQGSKGELRLIKVAPGRQLPEHGHGGSELTLILHGAYTDEIGTFAAGDVADLDESIEHRPIADRDTGCICLIAYEEKARFKGVMPRLMQPLTGM